MKMVIINYYVGLDPEVMEIIEALRICTYTKVPEAEGRVSCGEPREGSHVWPGANSTLSVVVDDGSSPTTRRRTGRDSTPLCSALNAPCGRPIRRAARCL
jgi:hypothetical protein